MAKKKASEIGGAGIVATAADLFGKAVGAGLWVSALPAMAVKYLPDSGAMGWPKNALRFSAEFPRAVGRAFDRFAADMEELGGGGDITAEGDLGKPGVHTFRNEEKDTAIVFVHGFGQNSENTWGKFLFIVSEEQKLKDWDIFSVGYTTNMLLDIAGLWSASPPIDKLAQFFDTVTSTPPLERYKSLAVVAHSMGGLVTQRALVDSAGLRSRVGHYICYGSPSGGLKKAAPLVKFKRQIRDMAAGSEFVVDLRKRWSTLAEEELPFDFRVVAGDQDEFVPSTSTLDPFPEKFQTVVIGNHLTIVSPDNKNHLSVQVLVKHLTGDKRGVPLNSARLAVEKRDFKKAIKQLMPNRKKLDKRALVTLSLALDSDGQREKAIQVIEESDNKNTDLMGILAGRIKRRWLFDYRLQDDADRARELYGQALEMAEEAGDQPQIFYHAVNVAFMELAAEDDRDGAEKYAQKALDACAKSREDVWSLATQGEAHLYLGNDDQAIAGYRAALDKKPDPWQITSMFQQAVRIAEELMNDDALADRLRGLFQENQAAS